MGVREREKGYFLLKAHEAAHVHIDTSFLPSNFVYDEHFRFAIFVQPSRCTVELCSSSRVRLSPEEFLPCRKPREFSNWFQSTSIPKNVKNNITVYALDDVIFKLEIHLLHGLYIAYAPLFENTTVVRIVSPSRAKSAVGSDVVETRKLSKYISFTEETISMQYIFCIRYDKELVNSVSQALNMPPTYQDYEKGRVLMMYNQSGN